jgi:tRNA dimethylallyltransferase
VQIPTPVLARRIEARVHRMIEQGLVEEVRRLLDRDLERFLTSSQAIGYVEVADHLEGRMSLDDVMRRTIRRTKALARRQMAWFRRDPRIRWFDAGAGGAAERVDDIERFLALDPARDRGAAMSGSPAAGREG